MVGVWGGELGAMRSVSLSMSSIQKSQDLQFCKLSVSNRRVQEERAQGMAHLDAHACLHFCPTSLSFPYTPHIHLRAHAYAQRTALKDCICTAINRI